MLASVFIADSMEFDEVGSCYELHCWGVRSFMVNRKIRMPFSLSAHEINIWLISPMVHFGLITTVHSWCKQHIYVCVWYMPINCYSGGCIIQRTCCKNNNNITLRLMTLCFFPLRNQLSYWFCNKYILIKIMTRCAWRHFQIVRKYYSFQVYSQLRVYVSDLSLMR